MRKLVRKMFILTLVLLTVCALVPRALAAGQKEFRAVWVASVYGIDYPVEATRDADSLKAQADSILDGAKELGMTAVILQVHPSADALYRSSLFPWSRYLTGRQGQAPDGEFDPLGYFVSGAHARGLELHAWLNPYRVAVSDADYAAMSDANPAKQNPDWVVRHTDGKYYFDPGLPETRALVVAGAEEIIRGYDVDGIHLDDYFYPGGDFDDARTFAEFGGDFEDIGDWRRNNVNILVRELHDTVKNSGKDISFGVSPSGIWANRSSLAEGSDTAGNQSYFSSCADSRRWVKEGWVDYICPQLYWYIGHEAADYETLARWWADVVRGTDTALYIGMADYQAGSSDPKSPWKGIGALRDALRLNRDIDEIKGEVHFSYSDIANYPELADYYRAVYNGGEEPVYTPRLNKEDHTAYIEGDGGAFNPEAPLLRSQTAAILARLMLDADGKPAFSGSARYPAPYSDVADSAWYAPAVGLVTLYGVMQGYGGARFGPDEPVTRAEFAAMLARFDSATETAAGFFDVPAGHWASDAIAHVRAKGYLSGYGDGSFRPDNTITRAEAVKALNRLLGRAADMDFLSEKWGSASLFRDVASTHWARGEIFEAALSHTYHRSGESEIWDGADKLPETSPEFTAEGFTFIEPQLATSGKLLPLDLSEVTSVALHHMAHPTAGFRDIEGWHLARGFDAIGYNFWVGFDGTVYVGRGFNIGAAVAGQNRKIVSIGFQGDYESGGYAMPPAQLEAGAQLLAWLSERLPSLSRVGGHRDFAATLCPGARFPMDEMVRQAGLGALM